MSVNRGFMEDTLDGSQELEGAGQSSVSAKVCKENVTSISAAGKQHNISTASQTSTTGDKSNTLSGKGEEIRPRNGAVDDSRGQTDKSIGNEEVQDVNHVQKHAGLHQEEPKSETGHIEEDKHGITNFGVINKAFEDREVTTSNKDDSKNLPLTIQDKENNPDRFSPSLTVPVEPSDINLDIINRVNSVTRELVENEKDVNAKDGEEDTLDESRKSSVVSTDTSVLSSDDVTSYTFNPEADYIPEAGFSTVPVELSSVPNEKSPSNSNAKSDVQNETNLNQETGSSGDDKKLNNDKVSQPSNAEPETMNNLTPVEEPIESKRKLMEHVDSGNEPKEDDEEMCDEQSPILKDKGTEPSDIESDKKLAKPVSLNDSSQNEKSKETQDINSNTNDVNKQNVIDGDIKGSNKAQLDTIIPVGDEADDRRKNEQLYENITDEELAKVGHGKNSKEYERISKEHSGDKTQGKPTAVVIPMITKDGIELDNLDDENANKRISVNGNRPETDGDDQGKTPNLEAEGDKYAETNKQSSGSGKGGGFQEVDLSDGITTGVDEYDAGRMKKHTLDVERGEWTL